MPPSKINTKAKTSVVNTKLPLSTGSKMAPKSSIKSKTTKSISTRSIEQSKNLNKHKVVTSNTKNVEESYQIQDSSSDESDIKSIIDLESISQDSSNTEIKSESVNTNCSNVTKDSTSFTYIIEGREQMKNELEVEYNTDNVIDNKDIESESECSSDFNAESDVESDAGSGNKTSISENNNSTKELQNLNTLQKDIQEINKEDKEQVDTIPEFKSKASLPISRQLFTSSTISINSVNIKTDTVSSTIRFSFKNSKYSFLSNFYCSEFTIDGILYNHVEGYYQSQKFVYSDPKAAKHISTVVSPMACKRIAYTYYFSETKKKEWDCGLRDKIMKRALYVKFTTNEELLNKLIATGNDILIEDTELDKYWGQDRMGRGENTLGKMLMEIRSVLKFCI